MIQIRLPFLPLWNLRSQVVLTHHVGAKYVLTKVVGTALYVFVILANEVYGAGTRADYNFTMDGANAGRFQHDPEATTEYKYNVPGMLDISGNPICIAD
jgi:hypothetical protein